MTTLPEIWQCLTTSMPQGRWLALSEIYQLIENNIKLDKDDYNGQSPNSEIPKWQRNVRNVLQYRKKTREIEWDGKANYKM
jgi:hypothetical protein